MHGVPSDRPPDDQDTRGIIDTIGLAFGLLNKRPYLIWIPVTLDLLMWSGFRITIIRPFDTVPDDVKRHLPERVAETSEIGLQTVLTMLLPTLLGHDRFSGIAAPSVSPEFHVPAGADMFLLVVSVVLAALLLMLYLNVIARIVTGEPASGASLLTDAFSALVRSVGVVLVTTGIVALMILPVGAVAAGLWITGVEPVSLLLLAAIILSAWLGLFVAFSVPALVLGERNLLAAMRSSYRMVQQNFLAVAGLLVIILLIRAGTPHALSIFADSPWSVPFAIVVHGYVAAGLIAAVMLFFQERSHRQTMPTINSTAAASG